MLDLLLPCWFLAGPGAAPAHAAEAAERYEMGLGPVVGRVDPAPIPLILDGFSPGLEALFRHEVLSSELIESELPASGDARLRLSTDANGVVQLDRLELENLPLTIRVRPLYGDLFDVTLLGGSCDQVLSEHDLGRGFWRLYLPTTLTLLGLSNTDQDDDRKLKAYIQAGIGVGGESLAEVVGPLGVHLRADFEARSLNRFRRDAPSHVRHELIGSAEAGLAWLGEQSSVRFDAWGELLTQWETRDADGKAGVDRQGWAIGGRLTLHQRAPQIPLGPDPDVPQATLDPTGHGSSPAEAPRP